MHISRSLHVSAKFCLGLIVTASFYAMASNPPFAEPNPKLAVGGTVHAVLKQVNGGTIIGGEFDSVNGLPRRNLARRTADGQVDPDWRADVVGTVHALSEDASGSVYVGGRFSQVQGESRHSIARLSVEGVLDASWHPTVNGAGLIHAISLDTMSNAIYIAGEFEVVEGFPRAHLAKLSGGVEATLDAIWNPSPSYRVVAMAVANDGAVYVGGQFDKVGGLPRQNIAKLTSSTGAADPLWSAEANGTVNALAIDGSGQLYAGGLFDLIGGQTRRGVARLLATGAVDPTWIPYIPDPAWILSMDISDANEIYVGGVFNPSWDSSGNLARIGADGLTDASWRPATNDTVRAIDVAGPGLVAVGGEFSEANGILRLGFAEIDADASATSATDIELPGTVSAIAVQPNGGTILGGTFLKGRAISWRNLLRMLPDNGGVDPVWNPSPNNSIDQLVVEGNDFVYVAGRFSQIGGVQRSRLAKLNGAEGSGDPTWGNVASGYVTTMLLDSAGYLYLGGTFVSVEGVYKPHLARMLQGAGLDQEWNTPHNRYVGALASTLPGSIDVSDYDFNFPNYVGDLKRISAVDGSILRVWALDYPAFGLYSKSGVLYAFGGFSTIDGNETGGFARILSNGSVDQGWQAPDLSVYSMRMDADENIYVAASVAGETFFRMEKISPVNGEVDSTWTHQVNSDIDTVEINAKGSVLVGGTFDQADGLPRAGFVALRGAESIFVDGFDTASVP